MDPSIIKFLEDDEDESLHSGADVEAFTAALNRDIEGDTSILNLPSDSETGALSKGTNSVSQNLVGQWQASGKENNFAIQIQNQGETPHLSQRESIHCLTSAGNQHQNERQHECNELLLQPENCLTDREQQSVADPLQFVDNNQINNEQNSAHCLILDRAQHPEKQKHNEQQMNGQQLPIAAQANNTKRIMHASIPPHLLMQKLQPHLDKDRCLQLQAVYTKLKAQGLTKENFLRHCKAIVGDQMIRQVLHQLQTQLHAQAAQQTKQNQLSSQIQVPSHQSHIQGSTGQMPADASFSTINKNSQNSQETDTRMESKGMMHPTRSSSNVGNVTNPEGEIQKVPLQAVKKSMQQMQLPQSSFSMYGSTNNFHAHPYPSPCVGAAVTSLKSQVQTSQMRQAPFTQGMPSTKLGSAQPMNIVNVPRRELQNAANETKRLHVGPLSHLTSQQQKPVAWQSANIPNKEQRSSGFPLIPSVKQEVFDQDIHSQSKPQFTVSQSSSIGSMPTDSGNTNLGPVKYEKQEMKITKVGFSTSNSMPQPTQVSGPGAIQTGPTAPMLARNLTVVPGSTMPPRKPLIGQKKPLEVQGNSPPHASKKQKTSGSGAFLDQSIEQLNDVTAVSGVNLREEEEQLFSTPKEDSRASEATRRFVQDEEDRLILQKEPLQKKLLGIMSKCGLEKIGSDVERCLSMIVEERLRGLISNMIKFSKQRIDLEKSRHRFVLTSDVKRQILVMNQKAKEEWEKKQAEEAEKLRKHDEAEGNTGPDADRDDSRSKTKVNREEDDKMRTTAANVAARAAVGGDDVLSKWQLMAEQARQKREWILDGALTCQQGRTASGKLSSNVGRTSEEQAGKRGHADFLSGGMRILGRKPGAISHPEVERIISTKDLIAILEREPQMSRSTLIYRLYEKIGGARQQNVPI